MKKVVLSKPVLQRADVNKRFYLKTDFSSTGMGYALCQPNNDANSIKAMKEEDGGVNACLISPLKV